MIQIDDIESLARNLVTDTASEARLRCAISRAYYAAFHHCKSAANKWCRALTEPEKLHKGEHSKIYAQLEACSNHREKAENLKLMAAEAQKLKILRITADYQLEKNIDNKDHLRSLQYMNKVKDYLSGIKDN